MYLHQFKNEHISQLVVEKVKDGKLVVDPGVFIAVLATIAQLSSDANNHTPTLAYGKAVKIRPREARQTLPETFQFNVFGIFVWHYHLSNGGTSKNFHSRFKKLIIKDTSKLGKESVPKKHRMSTKVREWAGIGESVEEALYIAQKNAAHLQNPRKYADKVLQQILYYLKSL